MDTLGRTRVFWKASPDGTPRWLSSTTGASHFHEVMNFIFDSCFAANSLRMAATVVLIIGRRQVYIKDKRYVFGH